MTRVPPGDKTMSDAVKHGRRLVRIGKQRVRGRFYARKLPTRQG